MNPTQLSRELRTAQTPDLNRRRWIVGLSLFGTAMGQIVTLYQAGIIKHLPDPPLPIFDSDKVDASDYAYKRLQAPDAPAMITTYGITAWLASAGGKDRAQDNPWLSLAMGAKIAIDVATNLQLASEEWTDNQALCAYCQAASVASLGSAILALPEMLHALNTLRGSR